MRRRSMVRITRDSGGVARMPAISDVVVVLYRHRALSIAGRVDERARGDVPTAFCNHERKYNCVVQYIPLLPHTSKLQARQCRVRRWDSWGGIGRMQIFSQSKSNAPIMQLQQPHAPQRTGMREREAIYRTAFTSSPTSPDTMTSFAPVTSRSLLPK